ncbi:MAG: TRAP transporter small permease [Marinilabiliaceae bacterium]|jgi:TRAP-type C4-dicarboxylate transport system permease small subunit|nr:TRAP transporter small permease [Marinilabiliaceae bacterium]
MIRRLIDRILAWIVIITMAILLIDVIWQVASRYLMNEPSSWTDELAGYLLIWVGLLGGAYASGQKDHLAIDLLPRKLTIKGRRYLYLIINGLIALFAISVLIAGGSRLVSISFRLDQVSPALALPVGYVYLVLPLSGAFILFYAIDDIIFNRMPELAK